MSHKYVVGRQAAILAYIMKYGQATGQDLIKNLGAGKNTVYSWLSYLTKKGLLRRKPAEPEGRISMWVLDGDALRKTIMYRAYIEDFQHPKVQDFAWLGIALETVKKEYGRGS